MVVKFRRVLSSRDLVVGAFVVVLLVVAVVAVKLNSDGIDRFFIELIVNEKNG